MKALLFDMDGVLVDSRGPIARSINHALSSLGLEPHPEAELHARIGEPLPDVFADLLAGRNASAALVPSCRQKYRERYGEASLVETRVYEGIPGTLEALQHRRLAVATAKPAEYARPILDALGIGAAFEAIVGSPVDTTKSEDKSVTVGRALRALGLDDSKADAAPRAAMIGDRHFDVLAGRMHDLLTVGVTWGVGSRRELRDAGAHRLVEAPADLVTLLA